MDSAQYAELFLTESREHVSAINHSLLELERGAGGDEPVSAIFRGVHTIKGMSATMGYTAVASLSHELETLLDLVRKGGRTVDARLMDLLFRAADLLERAIESAVSGLAAVDVAPMVAQLQAEAGRGTPAYSSLAVTSEFQIAMTGEFPIGVTSQFAIPAPDAWTAPAPAGAGLLVRVRLVDGTPLKGVRAYLVVEAAKKLGEVGAVSPAIEAIHADDFDRDIAFRLTTELSDEDVVAALRRAGDVDDVRAGEDPPAAAVTPTAPVAKGTNGNGTNGGSTSGAVRQQRSVRIDLRRLDTLMNLIGELVITRGRLTQLTGSIDDPALTETVAQTSRLVADLQDEIMTSRMVPVWQVFDRFPRLVRDAARSVGKPVEFTIEGKEVELDRSMLDEVGDPIVHLLRNAIDHGIEAPEVRRAQGKPESGLSTSAMLTDLSGHGLGLAIVREKVEAMGGTVGLDPAADGPGARFLIVLPATLATFRGLLVHVAGRAFVLPSRQVERVGRVARSDVQVDAGAASVVLGDERLPLASLAAVLELPTAPADAARDKLQLVVIVSGDKRIAFVVDEVVGDQEVLVKPLASPLKRVRNIAGATVLGAGRVVPLLNVPDLVKGAQQAGHRAAAALSPAAAAPRSLLVAEDSVTSRLQLKGILEGAGYRVATAGDGMDALEQLRQGSFDLVVSDVEMPRLDGFGLTARLRTDPRFAALPVVLVTGLDSREDQQRGAEVGANAYIVKSGFRAGRLLDTIRTLL